MSDPLVAGKSDVVLPIYKKASKLIILGNVSLPYAFPVFGKYGEIAAEYIISYKDGDNVTIPLRNGYEISTAFAIYGPSRIDPKTAFAPRAISFSYDYDCEHYVINRFDIVTDKEKEIKRLTVRTLAEKYCLLIYAVTAEELP